VLPRANKGRGGPRALEMRRARGVRGVLSGARGGTTPEDGPVGRLGHVVFRREGADPRLPRAHASRQEAAGRGGGAVPGARGTWGSRSTCATRHRA
jgi:hypothetical protein